MEQEFDKILMSVLDAFEENPDIDVDLLAADKAKVFGLNEESMKLLQETNEYIDDFDAAARDLAEAKENGMSRKEWIAMQFDEATEGRSEEEKSKLANAITKTLKKNFDDAINITEED